MMVMSFVAAVIIDTKSLKLGFSVFKEKKLATKWYITLCI